MSIYKSKDEFKQILSALWTEIFNTPEIVQSVVGEKLIVKFVPQILSARLIIYIKLPGYLIWSKSMGFDHAKYISPLLLSCFVTLTLVIIGVPRTSSAQTSVDALLSMPLSKKAVMFL